MEDDSYQNLRDYTLKLLSFRPRSVKEISIKLQKYSEKRDFPDKLVDQVIADMKEHKLLDDKEFVRWWIDQRQTYRPKGLRVIRLELLNKGIDKSVIDDVLETETEEKVDDYDLAMRVIEKKARQIKNLPREKLKIKIRDFLARRGFDWETTRKVIDSWLEKSYNSK